MLPFLKLKNKPVAGLVIEHRKPGEKLDELQYEADMHSEAIEACAQDLISAIHSKDIKAVADALYDAFSILDSMPHEEGEHTEPHSYESQNEAAAEEREY